MPNPVAVSGDEQEDELGSAGISAPRQRVVAEPVGPAPTMAGRPMMAEAPAGRLPSGMGSITKPGSIFGMEMGAGSQVQRVQMAGKPVQLSGAAVSISGQGAYSPLPSRQAASVAARPVLGQAAKGAPLDKYPAIDSVLAHQMTGVSLTKAEAGAVLDSLTQALVRVASPENASAACVLETGPGMVEKAATFKGKLIGFLASDALEFRDFSASELEGSDKVIACAGKLSPAVSSVGAGLAFVVLIAAVAGVAYMINSGVGGKK